MSTHDSGGPAFPAPDLGEQDFSQRGAYPGMTLRDYFIAHSPPPSDISRVWGEVMVRPFPKTADGRDSHFSREVAIWWADVEATWRCVHADAMLRARVAKEQSK